MSGGGSREAGPAPLEIISVDDHVLEPGRLWADRLPSRLRDCGPVLRRQRAELVSVTGGKPVFRRGSLGEWCDWWTYGDYEMPLLSTYAAVGMTEVDFVPVTFDDVRPGAWQQGARLADMNVNGVQASVCFPNTLPRFCGQTFLEARDHDLALLCVQAYNDWITDEWCAGQGAGRLIPVMIVPLWSAELAAAEVLRCAAKGVPAVTFSENPAKLELPSLHDTNRHWDPFLRACEETGMVINLHIGSSSTSPTTAADAPQAISSAMFATNTMGAMCDYIVGGVFERFPRLRIALAEGQIGWMPYAIERLDMVWRQRRRDSAIGINLPEPPSSYVAGHVYGCVFDDEVGLANREYIGMEQIMFEVDFPHADSTFPGSRQAADRLCARAGLDEQERYRLLRGNAIEVYGLERFGISA